MWVEGWQRGGREKGDREGEGNTQNTSKQMRVQLLLFTESNTPFGQHFSHASRLSWLDGVLIIFSFTYEMKQDSLG